LNQEPFVKPFERGGERRAKGLKGSKGFQMDKESKKVSRPVQAGEIIQALVMTSNG